jgi:hypothetical protein
MTAMEKVKNDLESMGVKLTALNLSRVMAVSFEDGEIVINPEQLRDSKEVCDILCHEAGHFLTGSFYRLGDFYTSKLKLEGRASSAAFERYIPYPELLALLKEGRSEYEISEHFGISEKMLKLAYRYYAEYKGLSFGGDEKFTD